LIGVFAGVTGGTGLEAGVFGVLELVLVMVFSEVMDGITTSTPIGANGFGLPSFPSGTRIILESCKLRNAGSEKIESSNFIWVTLNNKVRNS
jgi:hypothetical protein